MYQVNFLEGIAPHSHKRTKTLFVFLLIFSLTLAPFVEVTADASAEYPYPAPTLLSPENGNSTDQTKPIIAGLSPNDSLIKIFIDGQLNGQFQVINHESGTANFAYEPFLNLKPGWHKVTASATGPKGKESQMSGAVNFFVEYPMPAPTMLQPVVDDQTTSSRPWFVGLTVNNALIKIYIDGQWSGQLTAKEHISGVTSFAYSTLFDITAGRHTVYAVAIDKNGKESKASNIVEFHIEKSSTTDSSDEDGTAEVKGEETTNGEETVMEETTEEEDGAMMTESGNEEEEICDDEDCATDEEEADTTTEENSNWPLIVGLMVLFVVLIIFIDNLVRKSRSDKSDSVKDNSNKKGSSGGSSKPEDNKPTPDELFPPPPPDLK